ncbi:MAG: hypothetical protein MRY64_04505 [Hyphomonadaceae bacterium]|nr:hypothetical protein [Hyphomonadaceae bacterium]
MTRRRVESFKPFAFQADFAPQPVGDLAPCDESELPASLSQMAALGAQLQAEAMASARATLDAAVIEKLEAAIVQISAAAGELNRLAEHLDAAGQAGLIGPGAAALAERAAKHICDGQGDLFATCKALRATG